MNNKKIDSKVVKNIRYVLRVWIKDSLYVIFAKKNSGSIKRYKEIKTFENEKDAKKYFNNTVAETDLQSAPNVSENNKK